MARLTQVVGLQQMLGSLRAHARAHAAGFNRGVRLCGLATQRASQEIVPVDDGNLKATAYTRVAGSGFDTQVMVGYTAEYAIYVHENLDAAHGEAYNQKYAAQIAAGDKYWYNGRSKTYHDRAPNQQAKFLENPVRDMTANGEYRTLLREGMEI